MKKIIIKISICFILNSTIIACKNNENLNCPILSKQSATFAANLVFHRKESSLSKKNTIAGTRRQVRTVYLSQLGVREATGRNDGAQVVKFFCTMWGLTKVTPGALPSYAGSMGRRGWKIPAWPGRQASFRNASVFGSRETNSTRISHSQAISSGSITPPRNVLAIVVL